RLRAVRKQEKSGELTVLSGADPLNLVGILTPEARVPAIAGNRVLFRDGLAIAALEAGAVRRLAHCEMDDASLRTLMLRRYSPHAPQPHWRTPTQREMELLQRKRRPSAA